jgi:hypothetical protein
MAYRAQSSAGEAKVQNIGVQREDEFGGVSRISILAESTCGLSPQRPIPLGANKQSVVTGRIGSQPE